ncbi:unnamed protein product [Phytomonas sp. Hart1]|nr:unnamed protein product [Phytomonas sp. Hart1]|eukprot:CCW68976.1 unnamed protein product [Phytomonas sp. isolate Hart1]
MQKIRAEMAAADDAHAKAISQLEHDAAERAAQEAATWRANLDDIQQRAEKEYREREEYHATELEARLDELRDAKDGIISDYERELSRAMDKQHNTEREVEFLKEKLYGTEKELRDAADQMQKERCEAEETLVQVRGEHSEAMQRAEGEHNTRLNLLVSEHKRLSDRALLEFEAEKRTHQMLITRMKESYEELLHKYNYRESRPEDVNLINQLTKSGHEKDKALKKAQQDLQLYKLELINREENYNKLFGRSPVIAIDAQNQRTGTSLPSIRQTQKGTSK